MRNLKRLMIVIACISTILLTGCDFKSEEDIIREFKYIVIENNYFPTTDITTITTLRRARGCKITMNNGTVLYAGTYLLTNDISNLNLNNDSNADSTKVIIEIPDNFEGGFLKSSDGRTMYVSWKADKEEN